MLEKTLFIYLAYDILTEAILAQKVETRIITGDVLNNNPTAEALAGNIAPNSMFMNPAQAIGNIDTIGLPYMMASSPAILEPIAASLVNLGDADDLMRPARRALIGGFGNPALLINGLVESSIPTVPSTDGVLLESAIRVPLSGSFGSPTDTISSVTRPMRGAISDGSIPGIVSGSVNSGPDGAMTAGNIAGVLVNAAITSHIGIIPVTTTGIRGNAINAINIANGIAYGSVTTPVMEDLNQVGVSNVVGNPTNGVVIGNDLPNSSILAGLAPTITGPAANGLTPQGIFTNTYPAASPGRNFAASKSILAYITGIDPARLGTNAKFKVKSASPISPTGLTIQADNLIIEGKLGVTGTLPFLGSVTVDGVLPDCGKGTVLNECGNGNVGIVSEGSIPATTRPMTSNFGRAGLNTVNTNGLSSVATNRWGF